MKIIFNNLVLYFSVLSLGLRTMSDERSIVRESGAGMRCMLDSSFEAPQNDKDGRRSVARS